jgi:hypothetical protein
MTPMTDTSRAGARTVQTAGATQPQDQMEAAVRQAVSTSLSGARNRPEILFDGSPIS